MKQKMTREGIITRLSSIQYPVAMAVAWNERKECTNAIRDLDLLLVPRAESKDSSFESPCSLAGAKTGEPASRFNHTVGVTGTAGEAFAGPQTMCERGLREWR